MDGASGLNETRAEFNQSQDTRYDPHRSSKIRESKDERLNDGSKLQQKTDDKRKQQLQIYRNIDMTYFTSTKPKDPTAFIDKNTQKIRICPGVPYTSTS